MSAHHRRAPGASTVASPEAVAADALPAAHGPTHHAPAPSEDGRVALPFGLIAERLRALLLERSDLSHVDAVVAIARGGVVAGALVAYHLQVPLHIVRLRYRDDTNVPLAASPRLLGEVPDVGGLHVLVVDDVSVSGATLRAIRATLDAAASTTLVLKGRPGAADHVVFDDVPSCVRWPWALEPDEDRGVSSG